jgi:hypothetical protein
MWQTAGGDLAVDGLSIHTKERGCFVDREHVGSITVRHGYAGGSPGRRSQENVRRRFLIHVSISTAHGFAPLLVVPATGNGQRASAFPRSDCTVHHPSRGTIP